MDQIRLPIRLLPRKGPHIPAVVVIALMIAVGIPTTVRAVLYEFPTHPFLTLFCIVWMLIVGYLCVDWVSRLLPRSPLHHLEISGRDLSFRTIRRRESWQWSRLAAFKVVENDTGESVTYELVASPAPDGKGGTQACTIDVSAFLGWGESAVDAQALANWFNDLREDAVAGRLRDDSHIAVPDAFRRSVLSLF